MAKYAEICRVSNLEAYFQQVPLVKKFWNFHNIVVKHKLFKFSKEVKNIFYDKTSKAYRKSRAQRDLGSLQFTNCIGNYFFH